MIGELPTLKDYVEVDIDADCAERLSNEEIVAAVNNQLNAKLNKNENMLETSDNTKSEPIPITTHAIQAIDCTRQFTLVMDNTSATEKAVHLTTILKQKLMKEKGSGAKQAKITKYFHPNNT